MVAAAAFTTITMAMLTDLNVARALAPVAAVAATPAPSVAKTIAMAMFTGLNVADAVFIATARARAVAGSNAMAMFTGLNVASAAFTTSATAAAVAGTIAMAMLDDRRDASLHLLARLEHRAIEPAARAGPAAKVHGVTQGISRS